MRKKVVLGLAVVCAFLFGIPAQGDAAPGDTIVTFTLLAGSLSVVPQADAVLTATGAPGSTSITGNLGLVTVTDLRGSNTPWVASASSTTFTNVGATVTSTSVRYNAGTITTVLGTIVIPASTQQTLTTTPTAVVSPSSQTGINTVTWIPTLTVGLPATSVAGLYTGTVTTSVA